MILKYKKNDILFKIYYRKKNRHLVVKKLLFFKYILEHVL